MDPMIYRTAGQLAQAVQIKEITSEEIVKAFLTQIKTYNGKLNAVVILFEQEALERAKKADEALAKGEIWGPLHGVPITVKEAFDIAGSKTTVNFKQLKDHIAQEDALVIKRLKNAGAIILGKTNIPTLLADYQTYGPLYPRANNPRNTDYTPGGSTGGGAAAVTAGFSPLELGSDIGGSVRIPSHFCGLYGLKPTENSFPMRGHVPPVPGGKGGISCMASFGPLARSTEDLQLAFDIISGPDYRDVTVAPIKREKAAEKRLSEYKLAWSDTFGEFKASNDTCSLLEDLVGKFSEQGGNISKVDPFEFDFKTIWKIWANLFGYIMGQDLPTAIRFLMKMQFKFAYGTKLGANVAKGLRLDFKYFAGIVKQRYELIARFQEFFDRYDFWLCPVAMTPAFTHRKTGKPIEIDGKQVPYFYATSVFTTVFNFSGHPVVVIPVGKSKTGLPIGIQIAGPYWSEPGLIEFARQLSKLTPGFVPPDGYLT